MPQLFYLIVSIAFIIYLIIKVILWLLPVLIILAIIVIGFKLYCELRDKRAKDSLPQETTIHISPSNIDTKDIKPRSNIKPNISKQEGKNLWAFIISLENSNIPSKGKISKLLRLYRAHYWLDRNTEDELYSYILNIANEHISTTDADDMKKDYEMVIQVIQSLQKGMAFSEILRAISSDTKETRTLATTKLTVADSVTNHMLSSKCKEETQELTSPQNLMDDLTVYKVALRLLSYNADFSKSKNAGNLDLYDYILKVANECINTAKRDYVKRECRIITKIIQLLKEDAGCEDILHAVFPMIGQIAKESIAKDIEEIRKTRNNHQAQTAKKKTAISQIVLGLQANAFRKEEANRLRMAEAEKQKQIVKSIISQIIPALENNAVQRENTEKENVKKEICVPSDLPKAVQPKTDNKPYKQQLCRWVSPEEEIEVQGIKLKRGNFYVGKHFPLPPKTDSFSFYGIYIHGPVVDSTLEISESGTLYDEFSSYKDMTPYWRYQYLMWLSGDIEATEVPVSILFFYLYGCEIKMFVDNKTSKKERQDILTAIIQLRKSIDKQYPDRAAYQRLREKLDDFIGHTIVKFFRKDIDSFSIKSSLHHCDLYKQAYVINRLKDKHLLSAEEAYTIAYEIYDIDGVVPTKYQSIAKKYFIDHYKESEKIAEELKDSEVAYVSHSDASYCHNNFCNFTSEGIEIFHVIKSSTEAWDILSKLRHSFYKIQSVFGRYNHIKRYNKGQETVAAIAVLPDEVDIKQEPKIQALIADIKKVMHRKTFITINVDDILTLWEYERQGARSLHKEYVDSIICGLKRLGYGIVPSYDIDNKRFNFGDICVIYKDDTLRTLTITAAYTTTEMLIQLASYIIQADKVSNSDFTTIKRYIQTHCDADDNPNRLTAVAKWRLSTKRQSLNLQMKLSIRDTLSKEQRSFVGNELIQLICANEDVHPKRIEALKKILSALGMEADNIQLQIRHALDKHDDFAVIEKKSDATEFQISAKPSQKQQSCAPRIIMDPEKLRILEQQTEENRELLSSIFGEEDENPQDIVTENQESAWREILKLLLTKEEWGRADVETICKERGQMLGAVLEQINDFAYSKIDDAVVEDDEEHIYVTLEYKDHLI